MTGHPVQQTGPRGPRGPRAAGEGLCELNPPASLDACVQDKSPPLLLSPKGLDQDKQLCFKIRTCLPSPHPHEAHPYLPAQSSIFPSQVIGLEPQSKAPRWGLTFHPLNAVCILSTAQTHTQSSTTSHKFYCFQNARTAVTGVRGSAYDTRCIAV